ncbi:type II toxin-antitoxin system HipA family toxin [Caldimonas sp. KR1-144]|uniref:type II toxin-antitoxin system HipA family toxin n=1 Tax=Caldimonas sp. KR1-144 TaxID=3400911 RepID=UPI003C061CB8
MARDYKVADQLHLWYLADPLRPVLIGDLNLVMTGTRGVSVRYDSAWLRAGFPLSEDLPLADVEHLPREKDAAAGAVDDARPDRWGERVIKHIDRPPRLSTLEMLYFAGDDRFGALGVSTSREAYLPRHAGPLAQLDDVEALHTLVRRIQSGEKVDEGQRRLIAPGTMGGARPKALIEIKGVPWVLKFGEEDPSAEPLVEHAAMTLAARAGIEVAQTRPVRFGRGAAAVAVRRFDRAAGGGRVHALSAHVALRAAGAEYSYPNLAQLLRRRGPTDNDFNRRQMAELLRRLLFNILIDNTDDHEKNHVLIVRADQQHVLAPAFDVLPTGQSLGYQAMLVGAGGARSSVDDALAMSQLYWLDRDQALDLAYEVAEVVDGWRDHFVAAGVPAPAVEQLEASIDRPFLLDQRRSLLAHRRRNKAAARKSRT